jgi:two-component system phosphate regulon response regulator OmpR
MTAPAHILIVDDEPEVRDMLAEYLASRGFSVACASDGRSCRQFLAAGGVDLVLLDISLPGEDGLSLARHIRETQGCGIIMVTGAGSTVDRVVGLEVGADDYIAKPFDPRELLARVRSVLRRLASAERSLQPAEPATAGPPPAPLVRVGRCWFNADNRRLETDDGQVLPLTAMEHDLLRALTSHPNLVLSRGQLLDIAHHRGSDPFDRSIDIRIARLRKKVEADPAKPEAIKTVHGAGYMFVATAPTGKQGPPARNN